MRLVSVTTPAPVTTPRIPSSGLVETSAGIAAAARAISIGDGRTAMLEAAICSSSPSRAHSRNHRNSGTQFRREGRILQRDLDRNTLHYFREVASGVVRRQQSELRSAGWCDLEHFAANELPGILVNAKFGRVADLHVGQLGFAEVRLHPFCESNERDHLRTGRDELSGPNLSFADVPVARSVDLGVTNVHQGCPKVRLLCAQIGLKLHLLRFEDGFTAAFGFGGEFTTTQHGLGLIKIGIPAAKLA